MQVEGSARVYPPEGLVEGDVIKVKGALRCAYCHGDAQGLLECCDACGVLVHAECRRELGRCSTLGCAAPSVQTVNLSARLAEPGLVISGARLYRWAKRCAPTLFMVLICFGGCAFVTLAVRVPRSHSPHRMQMARAQSIRVASATFHAEHRRHPASLAELLQKRPGKQPHLEAYGHEGFERFHLVTRGRVVWIAVEVDSEENPYEKETIRLLEVLYEHPPASALAPLDSSAPTSSTLTPPRLR